MNLVKRPNNKMNRGIIVVNTKTEERRLFMNLDDASNYVIENKIKSHYEYLSFKNMTNEEKIKVLDYNLREMQEFHDTITGTGRSAINSIEIPFDTYKWIVEQIHQKEFQKE